MTNLEQSPSERESYWRKMVSRYESSGMSQKAFSTQEGIRDNRLSYWLCKFRNEMGKGSDFIELGSREPEPEKEKKPSVELEFGSGIILRVFS